MKYNTHRVCTADTNLITEKSIYDDIAVFFTETMQEYSNTAVATASVNKENHRL